MFILQLMRTNLALLSIDRNGKVIFERMTLVAIVMFGASCPEPPLTSFSAAAP